jgi:hypothetical protein
MTLSTTLSCDRLPYARFMSQLSEARAISERLNEIADDLKLPPKQHGRQTAVAKRWGVSQAAARKWLEGESIPEMHKVIAISRDAQVSIEWLLTGRGSKRVNSDPAGTLPAGSVREPLALYSTEPSAQSELLTLFDQLTNTQQKAMLTELRATVEANLVVLREVGQRLRHPSDEEVASYLPPAPK